MNVVITGANGFIGSNLVDKFNSLGYKVFGVVRNKEENIDSIAGKCEIIYSEISDLETNQRLSEVGNGSIFYHLAWQGVNGKDKADPIIQTDNILMAIRAVKAAKKFGCRKFLAAGTIAEQAVHSVHLLNQVSGGTMYGASKAACRLILETFCKTIGIPFVWMQFSNIYGPKNKTGNLISYTIGQLERGEDAAFGPARQPYDFVFSDDLIEAAVRLGINDVGGSFYYIGSGSPKVLADYLLTVGKIYGREDLIKIGARPDDGIKYDYSMFDSIGTFNAIGNYVSKSFEDHIRYTIECIRRK